MNFIHYLLYEVYNYVLASFNSTTTTTTATINMRFHAKHFYSKVNRQVDLNPLTLIGLLEACLLSK